MQLRCQFHTASLRSGSASVQARLPPINRHLAVRVTATAAEVTAAPAQSSSNGSVAPAASPAQAVPGVVTPPEAFQKAVASGQMKAGLPAWKTFLSAIIAGCFISLAAFLAVTVGTNVPAVASANPGLQKLIYGVFGFPMGLTAVLVCGAELYTGNTCMLPAAVYEKKATMQQLAKSWIWSWLGNVVGAFAMVAAVSATGMLTGSWSNGIVAMATMKANLPLGQLLVRSILCNWLVCIAIWQANACSTMPGKFISVFLPISAFAALGLEHAVANMFLVPMGKAAGANITWSQIWLNNLLPVTLGNTFAGSCLMALPFALIYGRLGQPKAATA